MLCLGPKKSLSSPRLKLPAQGIAYQCSKVECEDHSAIQAPQASVLLELVQFSRLDVVHSNKSRVHVVHDVSCRQLHYQESELGRRSKKAQEALFTSNYIFNFTKVVRRLKLEEQEKNSTFSKLQTRVKRYSLVT